MRDAYVAEIDRQAIALGLLARLADGHDDPAPIRILAGDGGLHQRGIRNRHSDAFRSLVAGRALDLDLDEFASALAVADDLLSEIAQHGIESVCELGKVMMMLAGFDRVVRPLLQRRRLRTA